MGGEFLLDAHTKSRAKELHEVGFT